MSEHVEVGNVCVNCAALWPCRASLEADLAAANDRIAMLSAALAESEQRRRPHTLGEDEYRVLWRMAEANLKQAAVEAESDRSRIDALALENAEMHELMVHRMAVLKFEAECETCERTAAILAAEPEARGAEMLEAADAMADILGGLLKPPSPCPKFTNIGGILRAYRARRALGGGA